MLCAQHVLLAATVAAVIIVSLAAVYARRIVRAAQAQASAIERAAVAALPEEIARLQSIARGAERLVRDLRQR